MADKFIREIEDILERSESLSGSDASLDRRDNQRGSGKANSLKRLLRLSGVTAISPKAVMIGGIIVLLGAFVLNALIPGTVPLLAWAGLALFVIAYGLLFMGSDFRYEKRWRGRLIDEERTGSFFYRLRRWMRS